MGKIVMPKNSALLEEVEAVLEIYANEDGWLSNFEYKNRLKTKIGDDQYASSYTKKAQITSYFGFTEWEDISNDHSKRRITESGKVFYNHIKQKDQEGIIEDLIKALEEVTFGRNNYGCPDSDSDVEPPVVFIRAALDLGYLTYKEFAYLLWKMEDVGGNYTDALKEIKSMRVNNNIELSPDAQKYSDAKPIMVLIRWGLLKEENGEGSSKHITIPTSIENKYGERLRNLKIYNIDKNKSINKVTDVNLTPEWFNVQAKDLLSVDIEANQLYEEFKNKFGPDVLRTYSGKSLLWKIFLSEKGDKESLCYTLEYNRRYDLFGSISGAVAFKYGLYYSAKKGSWVTGSGRKPKLLSETEAIELGTKIRDELCNGADVIKNYGELNELSDYIALYSELIKVMPNTLGKVWVMKYFHMLFPELFPVFYSEAWQTNVLGKLNISPNDNSFIRMGQIALFVKKCGISNVAFSKVIYNLDTSGSNDVEDEPLVLPISYITGYKSRFDRNRIVFGAPGTGKSYSLTEQAKELMGDDSYERVTFHPDYTYANFVGTYKPVPVKDENGKEKITYKFVPGPFMRVYVNALLSSRTAPAKPFLLLIEEINRANVAAVFGDVFQLLDRDENYTSRYPIATSEDVKAYLVDVLDGGNGDSENYSYLQLPDNMFIWASMNSADQGVFPMDTAFKRRWEFSYIGINAGEDKIAGKKVVLGQGDYSKEIEWNTLRKAINKVLYSYKINEDKLMGPFFLSGDVYLDDGEIDQERFISMFKNKVIMYLFEDAAKQKRNSLFSGYTGELLTYSGLCEEFDTKGIAIFCSEIVSQFNNASEASNK